jgi:hypothetical protein
MNGIKFIKLINKRFDLNNEIIKKEPEFLKENFSKDIMKAILKNSNKEDSNTDDMLSILSLFMDILNGDLDLGGYESDSDGDNN